MKIIDCHSHFDPEIKTVESILESMKMNNISRVALMSKVTHEPLYIKSLTLMSIQRNLLQHNFSRNILKTLDNSFHKADGDWNPWYRKLMGKSKKYKILLIPDNNTIFNVVNKYPSKFYGWLFLNPIAQDCEAEYLKYSKNKNLCGLKVHPFWHRYDILKIKPIISIARKNKLPIMIHLGFDNDKNIIDLIYSNSDINFILSHCAFPYYLNLLKKIKNFNNLFVDLSSHHVDKKIIRNTINLIGSDRCLFGVDDPYGGENMDKITIKSIENLSIEQNQKEDIFFNNFLKIYEKKI